MRDVCLDGVRDAAARVELVDGGDGRGVGAGGRTKADLARIGKGERAVEKHSVHALANTKNGMLPAKALGNLLLAGDAVAQRGDERIGAHDVFHSLERLVESGCLDREDDRSAGVASLARTDVRSQGLSLTVSASFAWRSKRASSIMYSTASLPSVLAIMLP